jgi:hypothetical protein
MDISVSYKHKGEFYHYKVTDKHFLGRPVEVNEFFHNILELDGTTENICPILILQMYLFIIQTCVDWLLFPK